MTEARKETVRAMSSSVDEDTLRSDLENYREGSIQLGASQAQVIPVEWVRIDERVRLKCSIPPCPNYGRCGYCPPHTPEPDFMRKALGLFNWAVLFKIDVPVADFADIKRYYPHGQKHQRKTDEIAAKIETRAQAGGYRFAMGLGAGGCRDTLCNGGLCHQLDSGRCRYVLRARPSMEAVSIDVTDLVGKVGWEIYPICRSLDPELVPSAVSVGVIFIH